MLILGIESSCDETAVALVEDGIHVRSSVIYSQVAQHAAYGGVVPEIASRAHLQRLPELLNEAMRKAGADADALDGIAVTRGPGLATSLIIGYAAARALAVSLDVPFIGVNHLEAHLHALFLDEAAPLPEAASPVLALLVSGGHTALIEITGLRACRQLGCTIDDAAGEALDKGAKMLGLGYPGGPAMERAATGGNPQAVRFPRGRIQSAGDEGGANPYGFTFSGVKTSLLYHLRDHPLSPAEPGRLADLAASYQEAVVDALVQRVKQALPAYPKHRLACAGGVARNTRLRYKLKELAGHDNRELLLAPPAYCTDNAAMIAGLGGVMAARGEADPGGGIRPTWPAGSVAA